MTVTPTTPAESDASSAVALDASKSRRQARRAAIGSYLGATVEFYDFVLYATASTLIFPTVFFAGVPPEVGIILSYLTLAAGYVARPVGAVVFGHFGDRLGRKNMLIATIVLMGVSSFLVGLVPGVDTIGAAAPILLVSLRVLQGIGLGGEWGGAMLMAMEHAQVKNRGFAASLVASGGPSGAVLATLAFALVSLLPKEELFAWGWRIPFLCSALLLVLALVMRFSITESPEFLAAKAKMPEHRVPLADTLRSNWRSVVLLIVASLAAFFVQPLIATFGLGFAVAAGNPQADVLLMLTISNFLTIFTVIFWARLSDGIGRRRMLYIAYLLTGVAIWIAFALLGTTTLVLVLVGFVVIGPLSQAAILGTLSPFMAEMFPTRNRYTGVSLAFQIGTTVASGFAPLIAQSLLGATGGQTWLVSALVGLLCVAGAVAVFLARGIHDRTRLTID